MLQYTILILDETTRTPLNSIIVPEQELTPEQWRELLKAISKIFNVSNDLVVFGNDYYTDLKAFYETNLERIKDQNPMDQNINITDADDLGANDLIDLIYGCEQELLYELPNPLGLTKD